MNLPSPCEKCAPFSGAWMETETGLKRCDCERGKALQVAAAPATPNPPVISPAAASVFAEMMAGIPFYPPEAGARAMIANEIAAICNSSEDATWLVTQMARRYPKWPGVIEMRAVFCVRDTPRDGVQAISPAVDEVREAETMAALPAALVRQLLSGEPVTSAASIAHAICALAPAKDLNRAIQGIKPPHVPDIPLVKLTDANRITEADMAKAVQEFREKAGKEALEAKA